MEKRNGWIIPAIILVGLLIYAVGFKPTYIAGEVTKLSSTARTEHEVLVTTFVWSEKIDSVSAEKVFLKNVKRDVVWEGDVPQDEQMWTVKKLKRDSYKVYGSYKTDEWESVSELGSVFVTELLVYSRGEEYEIFIQTDVGDIK